MSGLRRVDADPPDVFGRAQSGMRPGAPGVGRSVDAVAIGDVEPDLGLAGAGVDHVAVRAAPPRWRRSRRCPGSRRTRSANRCRRRWSSRCRRRRRRSRTPWARQDRPRRQRRGRLARGRCTATSARRACRDRRGATGSSLPEVPFLTSCQQQTSRPASRRCGRTPRRPPARCRCRNCGNTARPGFRRRHTGRGSAHRRCPRPPPKSWSSIRRR